MLIGAGLAAVYMLQASPMLRAWWGAAPGGLWWGIQPVSAGVFGVPAGFAAIVLVSLWDGRRQRQPRTA
jgi:cation/acetate symporter